MAGAPAPRAAGLGPRRGDGLGLLRRLLDQSGAPERETWVHDGRTTSGRPKPPDDQRRWLLHHARGPPPRRHLARRFAVRHTIDIDIHRAGTITQMDRDLKRFATFIVPDRCLRETGYRAEAPPAGLTALTLDQALDIVQPFVDPLLTRTATGFWLLGTG